MKRNIIYISCLSVLALFGACTAGMDDDAAASSSQTDQLVIHTRSGNETEWYSFKKGDKIRVFNGHSDLPNIPAEQKGIYEYVSESNTLKWVNRPSDTYIGLWPDAIQQDKTYNKYFFTATSDQDGGPVYIDQSNKSNYDNSDFLVARCTINDQKDESYWRTKGIHLHFRHVLSQLKVNVFFPTATDINGVDDGYFNPNKITKVTMGLVKPRDKYTVTYNNELQDMAIASVTTNQENAKSNLTMCAETQKENSTIPGSKDAASLYSFKAIIPHGQLYQKGDECLKITVTYDDKTLNFTYVPPTNTIMQFQQEKITVVNLTLLHKKAEDKVLLNSVILQDWITDKADMELVEQPK